MINKYRKYLNYLDSKLEIMFQKQAKFIKCKKGCAYCCKSGEFTLSELEYANMMLCFNNLKDEIKNKVIQNIFNLLQKTPEKFYKCPFLINNECSVYSARPLICRAFGLISHISGEKDKIPFCVDLGLNYAGAFDNQENNSKNNASPLAFNLERKFLRSDEIEAEYDIFFGEDKSMRDWLKEDFKQDPK